MNFVDPDSGAHTQYIERLWRDMRNSVPRFGNRRHHFKGHIAKFLFFRQDKQFKKRIHKIFTATGQLYNGSDPPVLQNESSSEGAV